MVWGFSHDSKDCRFLCSFSKQVHENRGEGKTSKVKRKHILKEYDPQII
jgi:hypothetical protein